MTRTFAQDVVEAYSVAEAIDGLERHPDLVILDVKLPDGDADVIVREAERRRPAPVLVAVSGQASAEEAFRLAQLGCRAYLAKPFSVDAFRAKIEEALRIAPDVRPAVAAHVGHTPIRDLQNVVRRTMVDEALAQSRGSRSGAARLLKVTRQAVQQMIRSRDDETDDSTPPGDSNPKQEPQADTLSMRSFP
ncbi:MAG: response regulator [Proteobacteria bacterium]|nr:response regulator [Pseudomonadota bacterium]